MSEKPDNLAIESLKTGGMILAVFTVAIILHFSHEFMVKYNFPWYFPYAFYCLEVFAFFSDVVLVFLTVLRASLKESHKILCDMGIDVPKIVKFLASQTVKFIKTKWGRRKIRGLLPPPAPEIALASLENTPVPLPTETTPNRDEP